ncbi:hypothetical protein FRC12_013499 [Ceratobasidium sp. 428]|nr:hypothetical protein FRC12_013499 [Ceratobasidium sp. 428]
MRNHQDAPHEETQTDSQLSVEVEGGIELVDLHDTPDSFPQNDTVSSMSLDHSQRNEMFIAAVKFLSNLSTEEAKKHTVHDFIEEAVNYITVFMDELLSSPSAPLDRTECVASLLHPLFVNQLFQLRGVFRGIAAEERPGIGARVTIISWVDDFLVRLCACILHLATNGAMQDFNKRAGTESVRSLQNNEARKAATQLPTRFTELPGALTSKYSSPAMARMALTLLYGTTVLRQRYEPDAGQIETQLNIVDLVSVVSTCITKYGVILDSPSPVYPLTFVEYAILGSLYTYSVGLGGGNSFVPHTEHNVVGLVDLILDNISARSYPPSNNSGLSTILAEDLCLVEWFWNRWGDGSTSFAATGLRLTRHWIQHYNSGSVGRNEACIEVLLSHSPCSFQALLHLVEPVAEGAFIAPSPSPGDIAIVKIVCEAYTTLAMNRSPDDLQYEDILVQACKRLCPYILVLGMDEGAEAYIHKTLLSFIVSVGPAAIRAAYGDTQDLKSTPNPQGLVDKGLVYSQSGIVG